MTKSLNRDSMSMKKILALFFILIIIGILVYYYVYKKQDIRTILTKENTTEFQVTADLIRDFIVEVNEDLVDVYFYEKDSDYTRITTKYIAKETVSEGEALFKDQVKDNTCYELVIKKVEFIYPIHSRVCIPDLEETKSFYLNFEVEKMGKFMDSRFTDLKESCSPEKESDDVMILLVSGKRAICEFNFYIGNEENATSFLRDVIVVITDEKGVIDVSEVKHVYLSSKDFDLPSKDLVTEFYMEKPIKIKDSLSASEWGIINLRMEFNNLDVGDSFFVYIDDYGNYLKFNEIDDSAGVLVEKTEFRIR